MAIDGHYARKALTVRVAVTFTAIVPFNNGIIRGKALWKQSHLMTYRRYTTHFYVALLCEEVCYALYLQSGRIN